jgi:hypothetical protein
MEMANVEHSTVRTGIQKKFNKMYVKTILNRHILYYSTLYVTKVEYMYYSTIDIVWLFFRMFKSVSFI